MCNMCTHICSQQDKRVKGHAGPLAKWTRAQDLHRLIETQELGVAKPSIDPAICQVMTYISGKHHAVSGQALT